MRLGQGPDGPVAGRRVAVTGLGAVSCCGIGIEALWEGLCHPDISGERRIPDFDPSVWFGPKEARRLDRFAQVGIAASDLALADAGELSADPARSGVVFGVGVGGFHTFVEQITIFLEKGAKRVSPFFVPMIMGNAAPANVSMRFGWRGPSEALVTACASGTHAITNAARLVASGRCDVAIGGGTEAAINDVAIAAFANMTALSTTGESRPFDARRDGFVMSEGAGALLLEDWDRAVSRARGSTPRCWAGPARRTPTTSPPPSPAGWGPSPAWSSPSKMPAYRPPT